MKKQAELFLDHNKLSKQAGKRNSSLSVSDKVKAMVISMETAQKSWIGLYDKYADGKIDRECFIIEKKKYDTDMERMEQELAALRKIQEEEKDREEDTEKKTDYAKLFLEQKELTEDMKEKLIEKVLVYPENRIEIIWKFKEPSTDIRA